jgi:hypothetical protein
MKGQYTHYIILPNTEEAKAKVITNRYDWQTFTYKEVEKNGKKTQFVSRPTGDNLKADIQEFMEKHSIDYSSSDTKWKLLDKIQVYCDINGTPTEEISYTYTVEEVDTTTDHSAKISDMLERHPLYFAPRISVDNSELCIKSDFTLSELKAIEALSGFSVYNNEEVKSYIQSSDKWKEVE